MENRNQRPTTPTTQINPPTTTPKHTHACRKETGPVTQTHQTPTPPCGAGCTNPDGTPTHTPHPTELLCGPCQTRLQNNLQKLPTLIQHLRQTAPPTTTTTNTHLAGPRKTRANTTTLIPTPWEAADQLITLTANALDHLTTTPATTAAVARDRRGHPIGLTAATTNPAGETQTITRALTARTPALITKQWAGQFANQLNKTINSALTAWPLEPADRPTITGLPCPRCSQATGEYWPANETRTRPLILCVNDTCGAVDDPRNIAIE